MAGYQKSKLPIKAGRPRHCHQSNICTNMQREKERQKQYKQGA